MELQMRLITAAIEDLCNDASLTAAQKYAALVGIEASLTECMARLRTELRTKQ